MRSRAIRRAHSSCWCGSSHRDGTRRRECPRSLRRPRLCCAPAPVDCRTHSCPRECFPRDPRSPAGCSVRDDPHARLRRRALNLATRRACPGRRRGPRDAKHPRAWSSPRGPSRRLHVSCWSRRPRWRCDRRPIRPSVRDRNGYSRPGCPIRRFGPRCCGLHCRARMTGWRPGRTILSCALLP